MISTEKINHVIQLAVERENYHQADNQIEYNRLDNEIEQFMTNLTFDEVKSLQVVAYLGRDKDYDKSLPPSAIYDDYLASFERQGWNTKALEISQLAQKVPLASYLKDGKKILEL